MTMLTLLRLHAFYHICCRLPPDRHSMLSVPSLYPRYILLFVDFVNSIVWCFMHDDSMHLGQDLRFVCYVIIHN